MSEKIRRIKKEPLSSRVNLSKNSRMFLLLSAGVLVLVPIFYFSLKYFKEYEPVSTASVLENAPENVLDKTPSAALCRGDECFWINKNGFAFGKSGKTGGNLVLTIEDKTPRELKIGERLLKPETLSEILFLRKKIYEDEEISLRNVETNDASLNDFNFVSGEGWVLKLSVKENANEIVDVLKKTIEEIKKTSPDGVYSLEYIDLRIPNKVFYKFKTQQLR